MEMEIEYNEHKNRPVGFGAGGLSRYLQAIRHIPRLSEDEERALFCKLRDHKEHLFQHMARFGRGRACLLMLLRAYLAGTYTKEFLFGSMAAREELAALSGGDLSATVEAMARMLEYSIVQQDTNCEREVIAFLFRLSRPAVTHVLAECKVSMKEERGWRKKEEHKDMCVLSRLKEEGDEMFNLLVQSNLRLVVSIAKRYRGSGHTLEDCIQAGSLGLVHAIDIFDERKGCRLSTYAVWWIRQAIIDSIMWGDLLRLPQHIRGRRARMRRERQRLYSETGSAYRSEVARRLGISKDELDTLQEYDNRQFVSFEQALYETGEGALADVFADPGTVRPDVAVEAKEQERNIRAALRLLSEREKKIIEMRFGIDQPREYTLKEVGSMFSLTRERIRQLEERALKKLGSILSKE